MRGCEDEKMICVDAKMRRCENVRCENVSQPPNIRGTLRSDALVKNDTAAPVFLCTYVLVSSNHSRSDFHSSSSMSSDSVAAWVQDSLAWRSDMSHVLIVRCQIFHFHRFPSALRPLKFMTSEAM